MSSSSTPWDPPDPAVRSPSVESNSRLTATAGLALFVLLAVQGLTILSLDGLLGVHVVVGFILLGPLLVKLASTGWRFVRYYAGDADYERAGPPHPVLRLLAPLLVVSTVVMFASGIGLLAVSPGKGSALSLAHKASFVIWFGLMTIHVLAYLPAAGRWVWADLRGDGPERVVSRRRVRPFVVGASIVAGIALGVAGLAWAHPWVSRSEVASTEDGR